MKQTPHTLLKCAGFLLILVMAIGLPLQAGADIPIPESRYEYSRAERQRIRYLNSTLVRQAHERVAREDYPGAKEALLRIIENDPGNNHARVMLINVYNQLGEYDRAREMVEDLLAHYPDYWDLYLEHAFILMREEQWDDALLDLDYFLAAAPEDHPQRTIAMQNRAEVLFHKRRYEEAAAIGRGLLALKDTAHWREFLAEAAIQLGDWAEAIPDLEEALRQTDDPVHRAELKLKLAYAHYNTDAHAEAAVYFSRYLDHEFDEAVALSHLDALQQAGLIPEAIRTAQSFVSHEVISEPFRLQIDERLLNLHILRDEYGLAYSMARSLYARNEDPRFLLAAAVAANRESRFKDSADQYRRYLEQEFVPEIALDYHYALRQKSLELREAGRPEEAVQEVLDHGIPFLKRVVDDADSREQIRQAARYELAQIYRDRDDTEAYEDLMRALTGAMPEGRFLYEYAGHLYGKGQYDRAAPLFERAFDQLEDRDLRYRIGTTLADIHLIQEQPEEAVDWLESALEYGEPDRNWEFNRARADYLMANYDDTISRLLPIAEDDDLFNLYIGFSFYNRSPPMPGLALAYINRVRRPNALTGEEPFNFFANRAYLYFEQEMDREALADIEQALARHPSNDLERVRLLSLTRKGHFDEVLERGRMLIGKETEPDFRAQIMEIMGRVAYRLEEWDTAVEYLSEALAWNPGLLEARYLRGLSYFHLDKLEEAKDDLALLEEHADEFPSTSWGDIAFLKGDLEDFDSGIEWLNRSLALYPYDIDAWQERGYQAMKSHQNKDAKESFEQAIQLYNEILPHVEPKDEAKTYRETRMSLKQEYTKLDKTWSFQVYGQRTDFDFNESDLPAGVTGVSTEGALQSQGGVSIGYRPPKIGFRNEKTLDVFLRVLANFEPRSWDPDEDSYQGGLGLMYKPFIRHNFAISIERLFKIGDDAENNWLWRNTYGIEFGERPLQDQNVWVYRRFYGEASYYFEDLNRWIFFGQGQIGPSFFLTDNLILTFPEGLLVARYQDRDPEEVGTYWYYGPGLNIRLLEGERDLTRDRWSLAGYAHYVWGRFDKAPEGLDSHDFEGWIVGLNFSW